MDFVYNVNIGEQVGTQTKAKTEEILNAVFVSKNTDVSSHNTKKKETLNVYKAMSKLHDVAEKNMEGNGLLTVTQVCDIHEILMKGLHRDAGKIRSTEALTTWNGLVHFYPPPYSVENRLFGHIDLHNIYMCELPPKYSVEETEYVIKCAARLMFEVVNTHPFGDGNGRTCHLLASYVLGMITPFPVCICHDNGIGRRLAIVRCRDNPEEGPREIAAMLAEGVWNGWKNLYANLEARKPEKAVPLVIEMSKMDEIPDKIDHFITITLYLEFIVRIGTTLSSVHWWLCH